MRNAPIIVIIFIIVFAITLTALNIGIAIGFNASNEQYKSQKFSKNDIQYSSKFGDVMRTAALDKTGLVPIEGYDAYILLSTFPGLEEKDFDNVEALQGTYRYLDGKIVFDMMQGGPIHSAAQTISNIGMEKLYNNLKSRYSITQIDIIITEISK